MNFPAGGFGNNMRVFLEGYGPVVVSIYDPVEISDAGSHYNAVGHFLAGGSANESAAYYAERIYDLAGHTVSGTIIGGAYDGEEISAVPFETDLGILAEWEGLPYSDSPYEGWEV